MFHYFRVPKKFMNKRGVARFSVESFSLTVPRSFVGEPFSVSLIWGIENVWIRGGGVGEYQVFPSKVFVSQCRNFRRGTL